MKYKASDLYDYISEFTEHDIMCECSESDRVINNYEPEEVFFKRGWRATKDGYLYCPKCAKKELD